MKRLFVYKIFFFDCFIVQIKIRSRDNFGGKSQAMRSFKNFARAIRFLRRHFRREDKSDGFALQGEKFVGRELKFGRSLRTPFFYCTRKNFEGVEMADSSVSYKCPNCGAPLSFLPGKKIVTCEYCGTEFEVSAIEELFRGKQEMAVRVAEAQEAKWTIEDTGSEWSRDEAAALHAFTCSNCGAELVCDENTMATECVYCGNPTMIPKCFDGVLKPDFVIPFKKTKPTP